MEFNRHASELKKLSRLLYKCANESCFCKDIDSQVSSIIKAGYDANVINHDIKGQYIVFFHEPNNDFMSRCVFMVKIEGNIHCGDCGFMGALRVDLSLVERHGVEIQGVGDNGFINNEDIRVIFGYMNGWTYENCCINQYYLGTQVFKTHLEAKTYFNYLVSNIVIPKSLY